MEHFRKYSSALILLLFCCYYCDISMFQHTHIKNGSSIIHSHMGSGLEHDHTPEQIAVIDILSTFQSESAPKLFCIEVPAFHQISLQSVFSQTPCLSCAGSTAVLRGPPQKQQSSGLQPCHQS